MLTVYPDYYPLFRCAAGACRHTCCAGWEIDIDEQTLETYRRLAGPLAARMEAALVPDPEPHFRLTPEARCPFLREDNLCELIRTGGEELLCQICRDHPRFRSFFPGRTEIGLGLCCEAAGALILMRKEPVALLSEGSEEPESKDAAALLILRDRLIAAAQDRSRPLEDRMDRVLALAGAVLPARSMAEWARIFLALERLEESWTDTLQALARRGDQVDIKLFRHYMEERETEYEQLLVYFLYRHVPKALEDGDPAGKAAFAVLSVRLLFRLGALEYEARGDFTPADQIDLARRYSAEIEYSEENMDALFDRLWEDQWTD